MSLPGFIQDEVESFGSQAWQGMHSEYPARGVVTPAMRDTTSQKYHDCLVDCRLDGGKNCATQCSNTTPSQGHGSTPGTSNAQALCCMGIFAACLVRNWGDVFGMIGCGVSATQCTTTPPCNAL